MSFILASFCWLTGASLPIFWTHHSSLIVFHLQNTWLSGSTILLLWLFSCLCTGLHHSCLGDGASTPLSREQWVLALFTLNTLVFSVTESHSAPSVTCFCCQEILNVSPPATSGFIPGQPSWLLGPAMSPSPQKGFSHHPQDPPTGADRQDQLLDGPQ